MPQHSRRDEFFLDLLQNKLYGWETSQHDRIVASICKGIELGDYFPPVGVHYVGENIYELSGARLNFRSPSGQLITDIGGHHRAVAHYIMNVPLKCVFAPRQTFLRPEYLSGSLDERWCTHDISQSTFMETSLDYIEKLKQKGFMYRDV
jgi:hypothetical protein